MNGNITIKGRVSADSEIRYTPKGTPACGFTISVYTGKDQQGNYRESWWCKINLYGDEDASFKKGEVVEVEGWCEPLKYWNDKAGNPKVDISIKANVIRRATRTEDDF